MNTEWERVNQLFHEAAEYADEERAEFIARAVQNDPELRREVQSLIEAHEEDSGFLETPALGKSLFRQFGGWQQRIIDALKAQHGNVSPRADRMVGRLLDGKYEIEALCGRGGMGAVYRATHAGTGRRVAVKVIAPELAGDGEFIERFRREAKTIGLLRHPNIVNVTDFGVTGEGEGDQTVAYLVMEYLEGRTLAERLKDGRPMLIGEAIGILSQTCAAMDEAHRLGVLHRDLKPENIWLEPASVDGSNVKILDFGIARLQDIFPLDDPGPTPEFGDPAVRRRPFSITEEETLRLNGAAQQLSRFSSVMGTPRYMSPEQCRGERLDKSSDVYSLGVIAYQMLTGEPPFTGTTPELLIRHRETDPAPLRKRRGDIPAGVDEVVRQALAKDKNARPATAGAFAFQIQLRSLGDHWVRLQADALNRKYRWKFAEITLRTQWKGWLLALLLAFATLALPGMSSATSVAVFGLLWLVVAAIIIWGQNATAAACALFIEQTEGNPKTDLRLIVARARHRRRDLARAAFRLIIPPLIHEGLSGEEARRRWRMLREPIRRHAAYTLFRRVLAFALGLTVSQQILTASAFLFDMEETPSRYFNIAPGVFFHDMSNSMFFWLPTAVMIAIAAFSLCTKSAVEQSVIYLAARKALGELSLEQYEFLPGPEAWQVRRWTSWKTYAPACVMIALIIGFHLSKFPWMDARMGNAELYSVKALHASGVPVPRWSDQARFDNWQFFRSPAIVQYLIEKGMDVNAPFRLRMYLGPPFGNKVADVTLSPLMLAISSHSIDVARLFIERGADANARDSLGRTMMTNAALYCPEAIELLPASAADINERTRFGPPLLIAARYQWQYLNTAGFSVSLGQHELPLDQQYIAVKILIEKGADPNVRDGAGRNALMLMSLEPWLDDNAEITFREGWTSESRQHLRRSDKAVELIGETLLNAGCDVNAADNKGRTPLMYAAASGRSAVVELLLKRGADVRPKDHSGDSALDWAIKSGDDRSIRALSILSVPAGIKPRRPRLEKYESGVLQSLIPRKKVKPR